MDPLTALAQLYAALYVIKLIFVLVALPVAIETIARHRYGGRHKAYLSGLLFVTAVIATALLVPVALWTEKVRFFVAYRNKTVMRDILRALR